MCGRFASTLPREAMVRLFAAQPDNDLTDAPNFNICPTNPIAACVSAGGIRRLRMMRWGFLPHWYKGVTAGPLLINARAESVATKPAFRDAIRSRRCLIPADGFYEWSIGAEDRRLPWWIERADSAPMAFAGVWTDWTQGDARVSSCAIITCDAGPDIADIHHREPVVIDDGDFGLWLGEEGHGAAALMKAHPAARLRKWRVSPEVNASRASGPQLCAPLTGTPEHGLPPLIAKAAGCAPD